MHVEYSIVYTTKNTYENLVKDAHWQFLIIPEQNTTQEYIGVDFTNSLYVNSEFSKNGFGFKTIRVRSKEDFKSVTFKASIKLIKKEANPFDFVGNTKIEENYRQIQGLKFKVDYEPFLCKTHLTSLPKNNQLIFEFDRDKPLFENLRTLNDWIFEQLTFKADVTHVGTTLDDIVIKKQGVCQDFVHLFCALARQNGIPSRYVSGYLHQGLGYFGDSQMHAWAEAYIPDMGWIGFDPTNKLLANIDHIKVAHGRDYSDCAPLKGVVFTSGQHKTTHTVEVLGQQQQ